MIQHHIKGVGDFPWLQASPLEAHLVCIVSHNTKTTNYDKGLAAQTYQTYRQILIEIKSYVNYHGHKLA